MLVKQFLNARVVFRTFTEPKGSVKVVENQPYSIRGYFIPAQNTGYQFITYNPIRQFYGISQNNTLVSLTPQNLLNAKAFRRFYANKKAVLEANDLSVHPTLSAPCVNVLVQDLSMYRCEVSCDDKNKLTL
ncbi:CLUMA_CG019059, isoform A [Clunio marinus]|nr:CLUMA_CG019059, isoform A [Clunio marinus]